MSSQELEKLLAALGEQTRGVEAPQHVERALLTAFREQSRTPRRRTWVPWALGIAASVAVLIGAGMWQMGVWKMQQPVAALTPVKLAAVPPPALVPIAVAPAPVKVAKRPVAKGVRRAPRRPIEPVTAEAPVVQEVATDFLPLEDSVNLPPLESGHVMRVSMPSAMMMRFGFPVNQDRMMDPVKADVVFGQDGIARAVRFVR